MPTGIGGLDEITEGGLPRGGVTVVLGGAGSGKTIFGLQVLSAGVRDRGESGIVVAFEESAAKIVENARGFSWRADAAQERSLHILDAQFSQTVERGGEFDLVGLLAIVAAKAKQVGAHGIVFDGLDMLLDYLPDPAQVRREIFRMREWVHASGLTAIVTAKASTADARGTWDYDFLQFMADCVVTLHHRVSKGTAYRSLRVAKYRGAPHSANEFPMTITKAGLEIAASPKEAGYPASTERVPTGIARLDAMLAGGYHRGSSVLITGAPGTAKTSIAAAFAVLAAERGEKTLYVIFDESPDQVIRNAASIGIKLGPQVAAGTLLLRSLRGRAEDPEANVARVRALIREFQPRNIVVDPLSALEQFGSDVDVEGAALQVLELAKSLGITIVSTSLLGNTAPLHDQTPLNISTIADTWMHVSYLDKGGERNRALTIIKSRGTGHSNQVRELILTNEGMTLADVYSVGGEVLMGTLRWEKENEARRARTMAASRTILRQQKAELALAETKAQMETLGRARAIQETELDQLTVAIAAEDKHDVGEADERLYRRRADSPPATGADR